MWITRGNNQHKNYNTGSNQLVYSEKDSLKQLRLKNNNNFNNRCLYIFYIKNILFVITLYEQSYII